MEYIFYDIDRNVVWKNPLIFAFGRFIQQVKYGNNCITINVVFKFKPEILN